MKIYESKLANVSGHLIWTFCFYAIIAIFLLGLFFVTSHDEDHTLTTFLIVVAMWLGQGLRFHKMCYKVNDDALVQYDFHSRTILIDQIVSIRVLDKMKWVSFHTPYNMVIETIDRHKYFIAPKEVELLVKILKKENEKILIL